MSPPIFSVKYFPVEWCLRIWEQLQTFCSVQTWRSLHPHLNERKDSGLLLSARVLTTCTGIPHQLISNHSTRCRPPVVSVHPTYHLNSLLLCCTFHSLFPVFLHLHLLAILLTNKLLMKTLVIRHSSVLYWSLSGSSSCSSPCVFEVNMFYLLCK